MGIGSGKLLEPSAREFVSEVNILVEALEKGCGLLVGAEHLTNPLSLLEELRSGTSMGLDLVGGERSALGSRQLNESSHHIVDNERIERITSKSPVPSSAHNLNLLDSLVAPSNVLDSPALELENSSRQRSSTHIEDQVDLRLAILCDIRECPACSVVETNSQTIRHDAKHFETSQSCGNLKCTPLIYRVKGRDGKDNVLDIVSLACERLCVLSDVL